MNNIMTILVNFTDNTNQALAVDNGGNNSNITLELDVSSNGVGNGTGYTGIKTLPMSISSAQQLQFDYTVGYGDHSDDLDYTSQTALVLSGGATIKDQAGNDVTLTLPTPGDTGSLGFNKAIVIETKPVIQEIAIHNGSGGTNNDAVDVTFSEYVYNNSNGTGDLQTSDFDLSITGSGASTPVMTGIQKQPSGQAMIWRISFTYTGTATTSDVLTVNPANGSSIYNTIGKEADDPQSSGNTVNMNND